MNESSKQAYARYRFKNSTCFKTCMLNTSKGGYCEAKREQIDHCLSLATLKKDSRDYRSENTVLEWLEIFCEEADIKFEVTMKLRQRIADDLSNTSKDCYKIAEKLVEEMKCFPLIQLKV